MLTNCANGFDFGWYVNFTNGEQRKNSKYTEYYVRCVKGKE